MKVRGTHKCRAFLAANEQNAQPEVRRPWMINSYEAKLIDLFASLNLCPILHRNFCSQKDLEIFRFNSLAYIK